MDKLWDRKWPRRTDKSRTQKNKNKNPHGIQNR